MVVLQISAFIHILDIKYHIRTYHMSLILFSSTIWWFHPSSFLIWSFPGEKLHNFLPFSSQIIFFQKKKPWPNSTMTMQHICRIWIVWLLLLIRHCALPKIQRICCDWYCWLQSCCAKEIEKLQTKPSITVNHNLPCLTLKGRTHNRWF